MTWRPDRQTIERARVTALMRRLGVDRLAELRRRSAREPAWFWPEVVEDIGIAFDPPWQRVVDDDAGPAWARWFPGGGINASAASVDRWADDPGTADRLALIAEDESGTVNVATYRELRAQVAGLAAALRNWGLGAGDACGVMLPMGRHAVVAMHAVARIGAIAVPVFSGFAAPAVAARLADSGARLVLTADGALRRGRRVPIADTVRAARSAAPAVSRLVVLRNHGMPLAAGELDWDAFVASGAGGDGSVAPTRAEDPFLIAYTSGTTGAPKGAVHVHGGFTVKAAAEAAYGLDLGAGDRLFWLTDMGWIMGPWVLVGAGAAGATLVLYDGAPDAPDAARVWQMVERHRVSHLGVSPTLVRALRSHGDEPVRGHDLSSLRVLASTGEPWNPEPYRWFAHRAGRGRLPIINVSGGTEIGAFILNPYVVEEIAPCSLGGPSLGVNPDVVDARGTPVTGEVGELVIRRPWPGMTRGIWGDPERYLETYWRTFPGMWRHGDWARIDPDGQWYILGRSDETLNIAGKRIGPAEVESVLVAHPHIREAAAVGVPDAEKGEALWCFCTPAGMVRPAEEELSELIVAALGRPFRPSRLVVVDDLPRTRSGKLLRRGLRALAARQPVGDLSTAENPHAFDAIRALLDERS